MGWNNCRFASFPLLFYWLTKWSIKIVIDYNSTTLLKILTAQNCVVYAKRVLLHFKSGVMYGTYSKVSNIEIVYSTISMVSKHPV